MRNLKKILAVIEPKQMRQVALERAMALSRIRSKSGYKIIVVLPSDGNDGIISAADTEAGSGKEVSATVARDMKWLTGYLAIQAMGFDIDAYIVSSKQPSRDIIELAKQEVADVIIKAHEERSVFGSMLSATLDVQLLRHSPVPVLIAKDHIWQPTDKVAIALDLSDPSDHETSMMNLRLLREAQELSRMNHSEIHIVNAIPPVLPPASIDLPGFAPELMGDALLKEGCRAVLSFAARHRIPSECCHIREGQPDDIIPALCAELKPTVLFIGSSGRRGMALALIGNICERVSDELDCDVAVITRKAVVERTPFVLEEVKTQPKIAELAEANQELIAVNSEIAKASSELVRLREELKAAKAELADTKAQLERKHSELVDIKTELIEGSSEKKEE